jgi:hypothetical protein
LPLMACINGERETEEMTILNSIAREEKNDRGRFGSWRLGLCVAVEGALGWAARVRPIGFGCLEQGSASRRAWQGAVGVDGVSGLHGVGSGPGKQGQGAGGVAGVLASVGSCVARWARLGAGTRSGQGCSASVHGACGRGRGEAGASRPGREMRGERERNVRERERGRVGEAGGKNRGGRGWVQRRRRRLAGEEGATGS